VWIITAWQCISSEVNVNGFKKCCISIALDRTDDSCAMAVKRMGMLEFSMRKMMALTVKMERVTLIGKDRWNLTCSVY
jgi:hypothetical protein